MPTAREEQLQILQQAIGYFFQDTALLDMALTHTSFVKGDGKGRAHNERLEYLGDAVLELCVTEQLYRRYPKWSEGEMTRARAAIVCEPSLYMAAKEAGLQQYLLLGHGEDRTGGRDKPSILSDALEALIGAIYLDGGFEPARVFVLGFAGGMLEQAREMVISKDYKSTLQEYAQKKHLGGVQYRLLGATGPDHQKQFCMQVYLQDALMGEGTGGSKQEAGQRAAKQALEALRVIQPQTK